MKTLICKLFDHHFVMKKEVTLYVKEYECKFCKKQVTTSDTGALTPLTDTRKEINELLGQLYEKRTKRKLEHHCS